MTWRLSEEGEGIKGAADAGAQPQQAIAPAPPTRVKAAAIDDTHCKVSGLDERISGLPQRLGDRLADTNGATPVKHDAIAHIDPKP